MCAGRVRSTSKISKTIQKDGETLKEEEKEKITAAAMAELPAAQAWPGIFFRTEKTLLI